MAGPHLRERIEEHETDDASLVTTRCRGLRQRPECGWSAVPATQRGRRRALALDQADFTGARALGRLFDGELDPLAFP
jgi:hypothetical protein